MFPRAAHARVIRSWAGVIENTPDGRPVLDALDEPSNVIAATMSSVGFGLSPAAGHALAELVQHGACNFADLSTLRLVALCRHTSRLARTSRLAAAHYRRRIGET